MNVQIATNPHQSARLLMYGVNSDTADRLLYGQEPVMRIGLLAVDKTKFPNIALGKISAYHKSQGDEVEWADPMFGEYDRVYASKIFTFLPDDQTPWNCEVIRGGTGYDLHKNLPADIDRLQPDYSIYPQIDDKTAYGFITRGCPNKCSWCVVPIKEGAVYPYMDIDEITQDGKRPNVVLMDNNILASEYGVEQLIKIADKRYRIDLNQGMSARLVTPEIAEIFARIKWMCSIIRFAADTPKQIAEVERAITLIDKECERIGKKPRNYLIYTMIGGGIQEDYERLSHFRKYPRVRIIAQPYRDFNNPHQTIPQWQKDMARWAMRRELYTSCDFKDFEPRKGYVCKEYFTNKGIMI